MNEWEELRNSILHRPIVRIRIEREEYESKMNHSSEQPIQDQYIDYKIIIPNTMDIYQS
jgi:hypothetical protein